MARPRLFSIAPGVPFLATFVRALLADFADYETAISLDGESEDANLFVITARKP